MNSLADAEKQRKDRSSRHSHNQTITQALIYLLSTTQRRDNNYNDNVRIHK